MRLGPGWRFSLAGSRPAQTPTFTKYVAWRQLRRRVLGRLPRGTQPAQFLPAILAGRSGSRTFQQPTVSDPGLPVCNGLKSLVPVTFGPISTTKVGVPTNAALARSYDNLSIPGFKIADARERKSSADGLGERDLVLRGKGSQLQPGPVAQPDFITLGIIGNDILTRPERHSSWTASRDAPRYLHVQLQRRRGVLEGEPGARGSSSGRPT
jgi:hypothetical protein